MAWRTLSNKHNGTGRVTRDLRRGQSQSESYCVWQRGCLRVFLGPLCASVFLRGYCNIFKNIASPVLFVSPIWCLRDTAGVAKARQLLLLALGPLRPKEITNVFTLQGVHHSRTNIKMLDACWSLEMAILDTCCTDAKLHPRGLKKNKKTNSNLPARQKSSWADSYHQAEAVRSHWYGVIEGFRALGRITGLEMIARFNRPLKQKGNTSTEKRGPFAPPIDLLLPPNRPLDLHLKSAASVSLGAKSPPSPPTPVDWTYCLFILYLNLRGLSI